PQPTIAPIQNQQPSPLNPYDNTAQAQYAPNPSMPPQDTATPQPQVATPAQTTQVPDMATLMAQELNNASTTETTLQNPGQINTPQA
ncbi:MAG: hypothetical protein PWQ10_137, partial [Patescibacteria group bacterium]|nr:hypothetical protein [Patescibacteria group bacterium]